MNPLLILREEIVSLVILTFFFCYSKWFVKRVDMNNFKWLCIVAIVHDVMDITTVITVNSDTVPYVVNLILHLIFIYSAILYCILFLSYTLDWVTDSLKKKICMRITVAAFLIFVALGPFLGIEIFEGNGTRYSCGWGVNVGYSLAYTISLINTVLLVKNSKKLDKAVFSSLVPLSFAFMLAMTLQIFIPELLFTGAALTIITIGIFFALENPSNVYMKKAYIDVDTGVKNRTCFEEDFHKYKSLLENMTDDAVQIGIIVCDLNGLKHTNDTYGHTVGDKMIATAATIMRNEMKSAKEIYRTGGDEFVAIYIGDNCQFITKDIERVEKTCISESRKYDFPLSIAMGFSTTESNHDLSKVQEQADANMYKRKLQMKKDNPALVRT